METQTIIAPTLEINSTITVNEDGSRTINFNAQDSDGTVNTTALVDETQGTVEISNNQIIYTPKYQFSGTATITVTTTDNDGESVTQTIDVPVQGAPNDAPYILELRDDEFQVNNTSFDDQKEPSVASFDDGSFIITWASHNQDGSSFGIVAQRFDSLGQKVGDEFIINTTTESVQTSPNIQTFSDGSYLIAWESLNQDGSETGIFAQKFDSSDQKVGTEFLVNTTTQFSQTNPKMTDLDDGFIITWESMNQDGANSGLFGQKFNLNGEKVGNEFQVNTFTSSDQSNQSITTLNDGFIVTWESKVQDRSETGIFAQRFDSNGNKVGSEVQVNEFTYSFQGNPSVTMLDDGSYIITWESFTQDIQGYGIFAQKFDATGEKVGEEFQVNTYEMSEQRNPMVTSLNDGGFAVTWQSWGQNGSGYNISAQRFDANGQKIGEEVTVNTHLNSVQNNPAIAALNGEDFVITWQSWDQDGSLHGIYAKLISSKPEYATIENSLFNGKVEAVDPDVGDVLTYSIVGETPVGLTFNTDGTYSLDTSDSLYTALNAGESTTVSFSWIATDLGGLSTPTQLVNIKLTGTNELPILTIDSTVTHHNDGSKTINFNAIDNDGTITNQSANVNPEQGSVTIINNQAIFTPTQDFEGVATITISVTDDYGDTVSDTIDVEVIKEANTAPYLNITSSEEFQINTYSDGDQKISNITTLQNGNVMVTWNSESQDGSGLGVYGQVFNQYGKKIGTEFSINSHTDNDQWNSTLSTLNNGNVMITWSSKEQDGSNSGIYGQILNQSGEKVGTEFAINSYTQDNQMISNLTTLKNGNVIVTWCSEGQDGSGSGIFGQVLNENGEKVGTEFQVNTHSDNYQYYSTVTTLDNGNVMVTWSSKEQDSSESGIYGQVLNQNGEKIGTEFAINSYTDNDQWISNLTTLENGNVMITWSSKGQDGSASGIYGQILNQSGEKVGTEFAINSYTDNDQWISNLTTLNNGNVMVTWSSKGQDGSDSSIYGQILNQNGEKVGTEFQLNAHTNDYQYYSTLTSLENDNVMITWSSKNQDGSGFGIYGRILDQDGNIIESQSPIETTENTIYNGQVVQAQDDEGHALTYSVIGDVPEGLTFNSDGTYSFNTAHSTYLALTEGETLDISFDWIATDIGGLSTSSHTINITITGSNTTPTLEINSTITVNEDGSRTINFNAQDSDGTVNTTALVDETQGTVEISNNQIIYTPKYQFSGTATITVTTTDNDGESVTQTIDVPVQGAPNDAPYILELRDDEFQVNNTSFDDQKEPSVASFDDGSFIITWASHNQDGSSFGIVAQRFDSLGQKVGDEFIINTTTESVQTSPNIQTFSDGSYLIAWESLNQDGSETGIFAQKFDSSDQKVGTEFLVNTTTQFSQTNPKMTDLDDGFIITWESMNQDGANSGLFGQKFNLNGEKVGNEFQVNTFTSSDQSNQSITTLNDGFIVTWESKVQDRSETGIFAQRFDSNGNKVGSEVQVNEFTYSFQGNPSVTMLDDGSYIITWESFTQDIQGYGIFAQKFDATGEKVGEEFQVNTYEMSEQRNPMVTSLNDGGFAVTWQSWGQNGSGYNISAQRFDANGQKIGEEVTVNTHLNSVQNNPAIAALNGEDFVITWQSWDQDGSLHGIYAKLISSKPEYATIENSLFNGKVEAVDPDVGDVLTYSIVGETPVGLTFNTDGTYSLDTSDSLYTALNAGESTTVSFSWIATDLGGLSTPTQLVNIILTGTVDNIILIDIIENVKESSLDDATEQDMSNFIIESDTITFNTTYQYEILNSEQMESITNKLDTALEYTILALIPTLKDSDITINFDTATENKLGLDIVINTEDDHTVLELIQSVDFDNLIFKTLNISLPLEDAIHKGNVTNTNTIEDIENTSFEIDESTISLELTTQHKALISLFEFTKDTIKNPSSIIETLKEIVSTRSLGETSLEESTLTIPNVITEMMIQSGLLHIHIDDNGEYQIFSPLFNVLNEKDEMTVSFGYSATNSDTLATGNITVNITGTNDSPVSIADNENLSLQSSSDTVSSMLPGAYTISTIQNLAGKTLGNSEISDLINTESLIQIIKSDLKDSTSFDLDALKSSLAVDLMNRLNLSSETILNSLGDKLDPILDTINPVLNVESTLEDMIQASLGTLDTTGQATLKSYISKFNSTIKHDLYESGAIENAFEVLALEVLSLYQINYLSSDAQSLQNEFGRYQDILDPVNVISNLKSEILNLLGLERPLHQLGETFEEFLQKEEEIETFNTASRELTQAINALAIDIFTGSLDLNEATQSLLLETATNFGLDTNTLFERLLPEELNSAMVNFQNSLDIDVSNILSGIDLNLLLTNLGINLSSDVNSILSAAQSQLNTFISELNTDSILDNKEDVITTISGLLKTIIDIVNNTFDTVLDFSNEEFNEAIASTLTQTILSQFNSSLTVLINTITETFSLEDINLNQIITELVSDSVSQILSEIDFSIGSLKEATLSQLLSALSIDSDLLDETKRAEIAQKVVDDIYLRISMDEDISDLGSIRYFLDNKAPILTTIKDSDGNIIETIDISDSTTVTVNADGSYTISNPLFLRLNSSNDVEVSFDYYIKDKNNIDDSTEDGETSLSQSETITVTIDLSELEGNQQNEAPVSQEDTLVKLVNEDTIFKGTVQATDADNDSLTYIVMGTTPAGLTFNSDGTYSFDANHQTYQSLNENDTQTITFNWVAVDTMGASSEEQTTTLQINGQNDVALIDANNMSIIENSHSISSTVTSTDIDNLDNKFQAVSNIQATYGLYSVTENGEWEYILDNENSSVNQLNELSPTLNDTLTVTSLDGTTHDITISIMGVNDLPTLTIDTTIITNNDGTKTINFEATDSDGTVNTTASINPEHGSVEVINGQVIFTPQESFNGDTTITITTVDSSGAIVSKSIDLYVNKAPYILELRDDEFQVNNTSFDDQKEPSVASFDDGSFIITWASHNQDGSSFGIVAQRFDSLGQKVGDEFIINTTTESVQTSPNIQTFSDGSYLIAWESLNQDGSETGIFAQKFDSSDQKVGTEFLVNTTTQFSQTNPKMTDLDDGFIITWESMNQDGANSGLFGQKFNLNGEKVGNEFQVNTFTSSDQSNQSITTLNDGFIVTWESKVQDRSETGIFAQRFDSNGNKVGSEVQVNEFTYSFQGNPSVTMLDDGSYIITWESFTQDIQGYGIFAQKFDATGEKVGEEFQVNTYEMSEQRNPMVTSLNDGGFAVTWQSWGQNGSGYNISAQRFDANGQKIGEEVTVNTHLNSVQNNPAIAALNGEDFVITWQSWDQDGSLHGIYAKLISAEQNLLTYENKTFEGNVEATDTQDDTLTYSLVGDAPIGLTFNPDGTYTLDTTDNSYLALSADEEKMVSFSWIATDSHGVSTNEQTITITIKGINNTPTITDVTFPSENNESSLVGYYDMYSNEGVYNQIDSIENANLTPLKVLNLAESELKELAILYVQNPSNENFGSEYIQQLNVIENAVQDGLKLIIHDRYVTNGQTILPGGESIITVRTFENSRDIEITEEGEILKSTNYGSIDNDSLDNGGYSNHGYIEVDSLPEGSVVLLTNGQENQAVTFSYPFGEGMVIYSTIPLDHYLDRDNSGIYENMDIYAANLLSALHTINKLYEAKDEYTAYSNTLTVEDKDINDTHIFKIVGLISGLDDVNNSSLILEENGIFTLTGDFNFLAQGEEREIIFNYVAIDDSGNHLTNSSDEKTVTITITGTNDKPIVSHYDNNAITQENIIYNNHVSATDIDNDSLTYSLVGNAPTGLTFNSDGTYTLDTTDNSYLALSEGEEMTVSFKWIATDTHGATTEEQTVNIKVVGNSTPPTIELDPIDIAVNTYTNDYQGEQSMTTLEDGSVLITWISKNQDGDGNGIFAQRVSQNGEKLGEEFQVNTTSHHHQSSPSVTMLSTGGYIIAWHSHQDADGYGIFAQVFNENNEKVGSEFQVNTYTSSTQANVALTTLDNNEVIVTWTSVGQDGSVGGIYAQKVSANGTKIDNEFRVNTTTQDYQDNPQIISLLNNQFAITWTSTSQDGSGHGIYMQRFDSNGNKIGVETLVNTSTVNNQFNATISNLSNGDYIVTWHSNHDDSKYNIYAQRFTNGGEKIGSEFLVNSTTQGYQYNPKTTLLSDGSFVIVWGSDENSNSNYDVIGQKFSVTGEKIGDEFTINQYSFNQQSSPDITELEEGSFMVSWMSNGQDGSSFGIYAQVFDQDANAMHPESLIKPSSILETGTNGIIGEANESLYFYTLNEHGVDRLIFGTTSNDEFTIDMATLLQNITLNEIETIELSGDIDLSNFNLNDFISITDDNNILKIMGSSEDSVELDANEWKEKIDINTSQHQQEDGYYVYTSSADETIKLLIESSIQTDIV